MFFSCSLFSCFTFKTNCHSTCIVTDMTILKVLGYLANVDLENINFEMFHVLFVTLQLPVSWLKIWSNPYTWIMTEMNWVTMQEFNLEVGCQRSSQLSVSDCLSSDRRSMNVIEEESGLEEMGKDCTIKLIGEYTIQGKPE